MRNSIYETYKNFDVLDIPELKLKYIPVPYAIKCPNCKYMMLTKMVSLGQVKIKCFKCNYKQKYLLPLALFAEGEE